MMQFLSAVCSTATALALLQDASTILPLTSSTKTFCNHHQPTSENADLEALPEKPDRCENGPKTKLLLGCHLALGKVSTPIQWLLVLNLTQENSNASLIAKVMSCRLSEALTFFADEWELTGPLLVLLISCYSLSGPMWAVKRSCATAAYIIMVCCWLSVVLAGILCAHFHASVSETVLVALPCSVNVGTSLGLLWHHRSGAESCLRQGQSSTQALTPAEKQKNLAREI